MYTCNIITANQRTGTHFYVLNIRIRSEWYERSEGEREKEKTLLTVCMHFEPFYSFIVCIFNFYPSPIWICVFYASVCVYVCLWMCPVSMVCKIRWAAVAAATTTSHYQFDTIDTWKRWKMHTRTGDTRSNIEYEYWHIHTPLKSKSFAFLWRELFAISTPAQQFSIPHKLILSIHIFVAVFFVHCRHFLLAYIRVTHSHNFIRFTHFTYYIYSLLTGSCISFFECEYVCVF